MASVDVQVNLQLSQRQLNAVTRQIQSSLGNLSAKNLTTIDRELNKGAKSAQTFGEAIGLSARRFVAYTSAVAVVGRLSSALARATRDAIKFEREFVKLAQVFDTSVKSLGSLSGEISDLSKEFGINANVIARTSVVLAQSGLSARDTEKALRSLAKTTLASTFEDIGSTAEGAVAILAQFETNVNSLESQLGSINAVAKTFAVESGDIIEAVRRAGGAFSAAGGTLEEFIALFTSVRSTTRESAETISTGFRTIFARIQRPKVIDYFKELGIVLEENGQFVGGFEAISRLSEGLKRLNIRPGQTQFAEIVEQLGGIRQVSRVIPLLTRFEKAQIALTVAQQGGLSLTNDVARAQETLSQAFARTTENFNALIREITQTESFRAIIQAILGIANALIEVTRAIKPLIPLLATFAAFKVGQVATKRFFKSQPGDENIIGLNRGGVVPGSGNGDTVPAMLTPGEFVIRKSAVQAFGADNLGKINRYADGGLISDVQNSGQDLKPLYDINRKVKDQKTGKFETKNDKYKGSVETIGLKDKNGKLLSYEYVREKGEEITDAAIAEYRKNPQTPAKQRLAATNKFLAQEEYLDQYALNFKQKTNNRNIFSKGKTTNLVNLITGAYGEKIYGESLRKNNFTFSKLKPKEGVDFVAAENGPRKNSILSEIKITKDFVKDNVIIAKALKFLGLQEQSKDPPGYLNGITNTVPIGKLYHVRTPQEKFLKKATGGSISGTGTDTVPALLTPGEFVINKKSAEAYGYGNLKKINKYAKGGTVGVQKFQDGGEANSLFNPANILVITTVLTGLAATLSQVDESLKPLATGFATLAGVLGTSILAFTQITALAPRLKSFFGGGDKSPDDKTTEETKKVKEEIEKSGDKNYRELVVITALLRNINRNLGGFGRRSKDDGSRGKFRFKDRTTGGNVIREGPRTRSPQGTAGIISTIRIREIKKGGADSSSETSPAAKKAASALSKLSIRARVLSTIFAAGFSAAAGIFAGLEEVFSQQKERAIELGNTQEALAAAQEENRNSILKTSTTFAAIGVAAATAINPFLGLAVGVAAITLLFFKGEDAIDFLIGAATRAAIGLLNIAQSVGKFFGLDFTPEINKLKTGLADFAASLSPQINAYKNSLEALIKANQKASENLIERTEKTFESGIRDIRRSGEDPAGQLAGLGRLLSAQVRLQEQSIKRGAETEATVRSQAQLLITRLETNASAGQEGNAARNRRINQERDNALEENKKITQQETQASLKNIQTIFEQARAIGESNVAIRALNNGQTVALDTLDKQGRLTQASLVQGGALNSLFNQLVKNGVEAADALALIDEALFGPGGVSTQFNKAFETAISALSSDFFNLLYGTVDEQIASAAKFAGAAEIVGGGEVTRTGVEGLRTLASAGVGQLNGQDIIKDILGPRVLSDLTAQSQAAFAAGDQATSTTIDKLITELKDDSKRLETFTKKVFGIDTTPADQLTELKEIFNQNKAQNEAIKQSRDDIVNTVANSSDILRQSIAKGHQSIVAAILSPKLQEIQNKAFELGLFKPLAETDANRQITEGRTTTNEFGQKVINFETFDAYTKEQQKVIKDFQALSAIRGQTLSDLPQKIEPTINPINTPQRTVATTEEQKFKPQYLAQSNVDGGVVAKIKQQKVPLTEEQSKKLKDSPDGRIAQRATQLAQREVQPVIPSLEGAGALQASLDAFNISSSRLAEVLQNHSIPETITLDMGSPTVNVNLNGAEILSSLHESVDNLINNKIIHAFQIRKNKDNSGDPSSLTAEELVLQSPQKN